MDLNESLKVIAARYGLDAGALMAYAAEDTHTGYDGTARDWPNGSLWRVEGQTLYALVRLLRPRDVIEIGTHAGCSATHIAAALKANDYGHLYSVDILAGGAGLPDDLGDHVTFVTTDGIGFLRDAHADFIYEDAWHYADQVRDLWQVGMKALSPGGMLVSHDALHPTVGPDVRKGIRDAGVLDALNVLAEPSDCGLALWRK